MIISPLVLNQKILVLEIAGLVQSLADALDSARIASFRGAGEKSEHRHWPLLRARRERPYQGRTAGGSDELPSSLCRHGDRPRCFRLAEPLRRISCFDGSFCELN